MTFGSIDDLATHLALWSVPSPRRLKTRARLNAYVAAIVQSDLWRDLFAQIQTVEVNHGARLLTSGGLTFNLSQGGPNAWVLATSAGVEISPRMRHETNVLHELAHCVQPRFEGSPPSRATSRNWREIESHGPWFRACVTVLLREFGSLPEHGDVVTAAFAHYDLPVPSVENLRAALTESHHIEVGLVLKGITRPAPLPKDLWGAEFRRIRRTAGITVVDAASAINDIEGCSPRSLSSVEQLAGLPTNRQQLRIAMCSAVLAGCDPVYLRHQLGVDRWAAGLTLAELVTLNARWVSQVEALNTRVQELPPTGFMGRRRRLVADLEHGLPGRVHGEV